MGHYRTPIKPSRVMTLRYGTICRQCHERLEAGTVAEYSYMAKAATCMACTSDPYREPSEHTDPFAKTRSRGYYGRDAGRCEDAPCCGCCS